MHPFARLITLSALVACGDKPDAADSGTGGTAATGGGGGGTGGTGSCAQQLIADGLGAPLFTISATSTDDIWVAGAKDTSGPQLHHLSNGAWGRVDAAGISDDLWWLWDDGIGTLWAGAEHGTIVHIDKATGTLTPEVIADPAYIFFGIWGSGPSDIWAVAGDPAVDLPGAIYHFDGSAWTLAATASATASGIERGAFKVWGRAANDVYVVGTGALSMHWDGATWTDQVSPLYEGVTLFTVTGDASGTMAVGGQGNAAAQSWNASGGIDDVTPPPTALAPGFIGVFDHPSHDPVASASTGALWRYTAGTWAADTCTPASAHGLHAVWVDDDGGIWAVGGDLTNLDDGVMIYSGDLTVPTFP